MATINTEQIIPGGIKPTDHWHRITSDNTCSRCRTEIGFDECPLLLWTDDRMNLLIYCEACLTNDHADGAVH
jgi:hypothetical protein